MSVSDFFRPCLRPVGRNIGIWCAAAAAVLCIMHALPAHEKDITVKTKSVIIRSGAGNYYEIMGRASKGMKLEILEERPGWYKVKLPDGRMGFVSTISLSRREGNAGVALYDKSDETGVGRVSSSEIMAATKGLTDLGPFAREYAKKFSVDTRAFEELKQMPFTPEEYEAFKKPLTSSNSVRVSGLSSEGVQSIDREIGSAIAVRISASGLSSDMELRTYVSMVGTAVLEHTPLYDEPFVFIVLESPRIESFAVPGGYIFITRGAIRQMKNEAELAGVLSHEIVHVVQRHGIRELETVKTRTASEKLMDSLDEELSRRGMDTGDKELMQELESLADDMFDLLTGGRKRESEDESDRYGTLVLYNTGYTPEGLKSFLSTIEKIDDEKKNTVYSHRFYNERESIINSVIEDNKLSGRDRVKLEERFEKNVE